MKYQTKMNILIWGLSYGAFMRSLKIEDALGSSLTGLIFVVMSIVLIKINWAWLDRAKKG